MQSLHYNSGSIKLTRERATMVARWEPYEVARWIAGLAGIQPEISEIFLQHRINGSALSIMLREDLIRMGITKLDQQLILMQSIDLLLTIVDRLNSETLALLFMRIHCTATTCLNLLKRNDESIHDNSNVMNSPEFYTSFSNLSDAIVDTCHWLGRLPFIENVEYMDSRRKIIKALVQIRFLIRNLRLVDQINMPKSKLIFETSELATNAITLVRQNKDSLFSSDCYLARVNLRRPIKDDVNIEFTTMPNYTHIISSIETEAMNSMGSGFGAINIGDEIIEINNQVVIGWDPIHFNELIRSSTHPKEICLLVKKMPRHSDDEIYTKRLVELTPNPRRQRPRIADRMKQTEDNRTRLLEQEGEIDVESDDETLYQSKRSSQIKRDQHSSLPDLTETLNKNTPSTNLSQISDHTEPSSSTSSMSPTPILSPTNPTKADAKRKNTDRQQSAGSISSPNTTPKSARKLGFESYFSTLFRPRQDPKSVIADMDETATKDQPQLVTIKRIDSINKKNSATQDDLPMSPLSPPLSSSIEKNNNQSTRSSISNIFKSWDQANKQQTPEPGKSMTFRNELKMEIGSIFGNNNYGIVANKPPLNHSDSRKSSITSERRRPKRKPSFRKISCKDLGKGDCEGFLYRYLSKGALSIVQWRLYWCVLKGGTLYIFKSKDDKNQELEIKLEGKNVSPAPERRKYGFRVADENSKYHEYFYCSTRDEMAKWMNKMGLAAINFNMDDSKIGGFNKGFVESREGSPASTPIIGGTSSTSSSQQRVEQISSTGDSENDSDKDSVISWRKSTSQHSSVSDTEPTQNKNDKRADLTSFARHARSSSAASILSDTHNSTIASPSNRFVGQINTALNKGHHRTNSSPVQIPSSYGDDQENTYVYAAPRLSDSDSSSEHPYQRMFINNDSIQNERPYEMIRSLANDQQPSKLANSALAFPISSVDPHSSSSQRLSNNTVFLTGGEETLLPPPNNIDTSINSSSSSSSSSAASTQQHSPATIRTAPLYISVYTSTPPIPLVKDVVASSVPPKPNNNELFFTRRSPSPNSASKKFEQPQTTMSPSAYKYHRNTSTTQKK